MTQPIRDQILTLDYAVGGQPADFVEAKLLSSNTLDYAVNGQPAFGISPTVSPSTSGNFLMFCMG